MKKRTHAIIRIAELNNLSEYDRFESTLLHIIIVMRKEMNGRKEIRRELRRRDKS